jgi:hypothetical protein
MPDNDLQNDPQAASPRHAAWQIARALTVVEDHDDAATRDRARDKVNKWVSALEGMLSGRLRVGSRQPMASVPLWATPEVVTGGFVTGRLLAGGPLLPHETELASRVGADSPGAERQALNSYFLTEAGLAELTARLRSGHFEIHIPEEGALLAVAWLVANGRADEARGLVEVIAPHFAELRFYPLPAERPATFGARVFLESVGALTECLKGIAPKRCILAEREAIQVWTPLYDQMIRLFLETVSGEVPTIQPDAEGRWVSVTTKRFNLTGGWPCRHYPADWCERARTVVEAVEDARTKHPHCGKPNRADDSFARLHGYLKRCAASPDSLAGRDVGMIRLILARHVTKRGAPGSQKLQDLRSRQLTQVAAPLHHQVATAVRARLAAHAADGGLDDLESTLQPITADEATKLSLPVGTGIPPSIARKVARCLCDTADVLVARGIVTSGETLARVIPQFTSGLRALAFDDPQLRTLYASVYRAFRRRRSLLLLNLEKQVRIEELPWVAAMERYRRADVSARDLSRQTLKDVALLTLRAFPQTILPNKLLQEFRALAKGGELDVPFVEELAADIFMDDFSPKFMQAAKQAAAFVEGSLYAHYYGVDCAAVGRLPEAAIKRQRWFGLQRETPANPFAVLCVARAAAVAGKPWDVVRNGMVIEQSQILTTHNLALLFGTLGLEAELRTDLRDMADRCFRWLCRRQQVRSEKWHAKLIMLKQTAYAWRQMIFFLSRLPHEEAGQFIAWAEDHLLEQSGDFRTRFSPALRGLALVHGGGSLDDATDLRRFLGWTQARHWLLGDEPPKAGASFPPTT